MPRWEVGDVLTTRYAAKVKQKGPRGREWLFLLPGCRWTVKAVEPRGHNAPRYTLHIPGYGIEIVRQEWRLKNLAQ